MKSVSLVLAASLLAALGGCAVVPYEPAPVVYAAPPPAMVVAPRPYYYGGYWGYRRHYWR